MSWTLVGQIAILMGWGNLLFVMAHGAMVDKNRQKEKP